MPEKEAMLKDVAHKAALPLIGVAVLSPAFRAFARKSKASWPAVQSQMLVSTSWLEQHLNDRDLVVLYVGRDRASSIGTHTGFTLCPARRTGRTAQGLVK